MKIRYAALLVLLTGLTHAASLRSVRQQMDSDDISAVNQNFKNVQNELNNTVHRTSTETVRGRKYFTDPIDGVISTATYATAAATATYTNVTDGKVLQTGTNGIIQASGVSTTTLTFLDASSSIQTQLNSKATITYNTFTTDLRNSSSNSTWATKHGWYMKVSDGAHAYVIAWFTFDAGNSGTAGSGLTITFPATPTTTDATTIIGTCGVNIAGGTFANWAVMASGGIYLGGQARSDQVSFASGYMIYPVAP
jgi:hypothetical protein